MRAYNRLLITVLAGGTVALMASPAPASAQAIPRTSSSESTSSAPPPQSQPVRSAPPTTSSSGSSSSGSSGGSTTSGGAVSSSPSGSSGSGSFGGTSAIRRGGGTSGTATSRPSGGGSDTPIYVGAGSRDRNGRPITGSAIHRASPIGGGSMFNERWLGSAGYPFSPWGRWYPWYSGGWGYGWVSYDPWRFGGTRWVWGRYGTWWYNPTPWYDPWYDPYYGWYGMTYWSGGGGRSYSSSREEALTGSVRVKVNPSHAQVYVDGVLQGIVDDFDGLSDHLEMSAGTHQIEIRADGYKTLKDTVNVEGGKTLTFRGSLKK